LVKVRGLFKTHCPHEFLATQDAPTFARAAALAIRACVVFASVLAVTAAQPARADYADNECKGADLLLSVQTINNAGDVGKTRETVCVPRKRREALKTEAESCPGVLAYKAAWATHDKAAISAAKGAMTDCFAGLYQSHANKTAQVLAQGLSAMPAWAREDALAECGTSGGAKETWAPHDLIHCVYRKAEAAETGAYDLEGLQENGFAELKKTLGTPERRKRLLEQSVFSAHLIKTCGEGGGKAWEKCLESEIATITAESDFGDSIEKLEQAFVGSLEIPQLGKQCGMMIGSSRGVTKSGVGKDCDKGSEWVDTLLNATKGFGKGKGKARGKKRAPVDASPPQVFEMALPEPAKPVRSKPTQHARSKPKPKLQSISPFQEFEKSSCKASDVEGGCETKIATYLASEACQGKSDGLCGEVRASLQEIQGVPIDQRSKPQACALLNLKIEGKKKLDPCLDTNMRVQLKPKDLQEGEKPIFCPDQFARYNCNAEGTGLKADAGRFKDDNADMEAMCDGMIESMLTTGCNSPESVIVCNPARESFSKIKRTPPAKRTRSDSCRLWYRQIQKRNDVPLADERKKADDRNGDLSQLGGTALDLKRDINAVLEREALSDLGKHSVRQRAEALFVVAGNADPNALVAGNPAQEQVLKRISDAVSGCLGKADTGKLSDELAKKGSLLKDALDARRGGPDESKALQVMEQKWLEQNIRGARLYKQAQCAVDNCRAVNQAMGAGKCGKANEERFASDLEKISSQFPALIMDVADPASGKFRKLAHVLSDDFYVTACSIDRKRTEDDTEQTRPITVSLQKTNLLKQATRASVEAQIRDFKNSVCSPKKDASKNLEQEGSYAVDFAPVVHSFMSCDDVGPETQACRDRRGMGSVFCNRWADIENNRIKQERGKLKQWAGIIAIGVISMGGLAAVAAVGAAGLAAATGISALASNTFVGVAMGIAMGSAEIHDQYKDISQRADAFEATGSTRDLDQAHSQFVNGRLSFSKLQEIYRNENDNRSYSKLAAPILIETLSIAADLKGFRDALKAAKAARLAGKAERVVADLKGLDKLSEADRLKFMDELMAPPGPDGLTRVKLGNGKELALAPEEWDELYRLGNRASTSGGLVPDAGKQAKRSAKTPGPNREVGSPSPSSFARGAGAESPTLVTKPVEVDAATWKRENADLGPTQWRLLPEDTEILRRKLGLAPHQAIPEDKATEHLISTAKELEQAERKALRSVFSNNESIATQETLLKSAERRGDLQSANALREELEDLRASLARSHRDLAEAKKATLLHQGVPAEVVPLNDGTFYVVALDSSHGPSAGIANPGARLTAMADQQAKKGNRVGFWTRYSLKGTAEIQHDIVILPWPDANLPGQVASPVARHEFRHGKAIEQAKSAKNGRASRSDAPFFKLEKSKKLPKEAGGVDLHELYGEGFITDEATAYGYESLADLQSARRNADLYHELMNDSSTQALEAMRRFLTRESGTSFASKSREEVLSELLSRSKKGAERVALRAEVSTAFIDSSIKELAEANANNIGWRFKAEGGNLSRRLDDPHDLLYLHLENGTVLGFSCHQIRPGCGFSGNDEFRDALGKHLNKEISRLRKLKNDLAQAQGDARSLQRWASGPNANLAPPYHTERLQAITRRYAAQGEQPTPISVAHPNEITLVRPVAPTPTRDVTQIGQPRQPNLTDDRTPARLAAGGEPKPPAGSRPNTDNEPTHPGPSRDGERGRPNTDEEPTHPGREPDWDNDATDPGWVPPARNDSATAGTQVLRAQPQQAAQPSNPGRAIAPSDERRRVARATENLTKPSETSATPQNATRPARQGLSIAPSDDVPMSRPARHRLSIAQSDNAQMSRPARQGLSIAPSDSTQATQRSRNATEPQGAGPSDGRPARASRPTAAPPTRRRAQVLAPADDDFDEITDVDVNVEVIRPLDPAATPPRVELQSGVSNRNKDTSPPPIDKKTGPEGGTRVLTSQNSAHSEVEAERVRTAVETPQIVRERARTASEPASTAVHTAPGQSTGVLGSPGRRRGRPAPRINDSIQNIPEPDYNVRNHFEKVPKNGRARVGIFPEAKTHRYGRAVDIDGDRLIIAGHDITLQPLRYLPPAPGETVKQMAEKVLGYPLGEPFASGGMRRVFRDPRNKNRVIKVYDSTIQKGLTEERIAKMIQRELAIEDVLVAEGFKVGRINRDPELLKRGIIIQEVLEGETILEQFKRKYIAGDISSDALVEAFIKKVERIDKDIQKLNESRFGINLAHRRDCFEGRFKIQGLDMGDLCDNIIGFTWRDW
jgi:hypothetical protein